ncbi:MAG: thiamine ABC transporter substrate-binding protein [Cellulomonadaceae bacterium]|nr:thiamine ABC transporter substrate-binding protein [Cellulomonadaceae bacterium]
MKLSKGALGAFALVSALSLTLAGCAGGSVGGGANGTANGGDNAGAGSSGGGGTNAGNNDGNQNAASPNPDSNSVVLVTTNSFAISDATKAAFEQETGLTLTVLPVGSAGLLANQLVLTRDHPLGDAFFGVDNTFISRLVDNNVMDILPTDARFVPITQGDVCVNIDKAWFAQRAEQRHPEGAVGSVTPTNLNDLLSDTNQGLFVALNPATSSPGLGFLLATIAAYGDPEAGIAGVGGGSIVNGNFTNGSDSDLHPNIGSWQDYWRQLRENGVLVSDSWSSGYFSDFSGAGEGGLRPIIVSYSSSPASTLNEDGSASTTAALLDTCFRQYEYAGILQNANNPQGAEKLIQFLSSPTFQADLPTQMWVYPAIAGTQLPDDWAQFAPQAAQPFEVDPAAIEANRERWLEEWTEIVTG